MRCNCALGVSDVLQCGIGIGFEGGVKASGTLCVKRRLGRSSKSSVTPSFGPGRRHGKVRLALELAVVIRFSG